jgi:hypothetical protein
MSTSIIRSMYNRVMVRHRMGETESMALDAGIPAVEGFALGYLAGKGKLDRSGVPMDAVGGTLVMAGTIFTPLMAESRDRLRQIAGVAIGVGMARVGAKHSGGASHHGEFDAGGYGSFGTFGQDPLVSAAAKL